MSHIDQLVTLISNILQADNSGLRKEAQDTLVNLRTERPNQLMSAFLLILENKGPIEHRNFSATQLRLCLSEFSPSTYTNVWSKLTPQFQEQLKQKLFEIIYKEEDVSMKRHLADTLGEIAGSVISTNDKDWPNFKTNVWHLFQDSGISSNLAAFNILQSFFAYAPHHFKEDANNLFTLFKAGFGHENMKIRGAALKCFSSYLEVLQTKKHTAFQELVIPILQTVYFLLVKDNCNEEGLQQLSQMIEIEPKFFKKKFKQLYELMRKIFEIPKLQQGIKRMATQLMIDFAQKYPALFRKKGDILNGVIEMIFTHMIEIDSEITDQWKKPDEGYNDDMQDDQDFETTRFGMGAVDRLIASVGEEELLPVLSNTIQKMLVQNDWRYKYTAVMALSQIGEYIDQADKISSIMQLIAAYLSDQNPMLRYASCHAIGQISDDMQPKFQQRYGELLLPELIKLLKDPIPRVVSHAAASLTNFLEGMKYESIQGSLDTLMELLLYHALNGISLVKQSALSTVSSVAEVCLKNFAKYFQKTVEILFNIFHTHQGKQYKQLKGQAIETLTIIASSVGAQIFKPVAQKLINLMIQIQTSQFEQVDPQKTYILAGWQRICLVYGKNLSGYLDKILPSLFILVENVIKNQLQVSTNPDQQKLNQKLQSDKDDNINTFETEEAEVAISMLNVFIEQLKELYAPYVEKTVQLLCTIIKDHPNDDVKQEACKCLPNLIAAAKSTNQQVAVTLAKYFMDTLVSTIEKQFDTDIMIVELETLKNIIEELGLQFLTNDQVKAFSEKILNLLKSSDQKKAHSKNYINEQDVDEEEKEMIGEQIKMQQEVQVAISQLIGILFKTHKDSTMPLAYHIIKTVLPEVFKAGQSENMYKFGIFIIDDMIEYLGFERLKDNWFHFAELLVQFSQEKSCVIRQAACYGLGIFAENTPTAALQPQNINHWLERLISAAKISKGAQKQKTYGHCRDNAIASVGKIVKAHGHAFDAKPYLDVWLSFLPLKHDKPEGIVQHELLVDIMCMKPQMIVGVVEPEITNKMTRVLSLYAEINANTKITNAQIKAKMSNHLQTLQNNEAYKNNLMNIWASFNDKQRKQLNEIANSK